MKSSRIAIIAAFCLLLVSATAAFAAGPLANRPAGDSFGRPPLAGEPMERLEAEKARVQQMLTDGRINQTRADALLTGIEARIAELQSFNALTLAEKRAKLINDFTAEVNSRVQAGNLSQEKAAAIIAAYTEKVNAWNGIGPPRLPGGLGRPGRFQNRMESRPNCANRLDAAVKDKVITLEQAAALQKYFTR